MYRSVLVAVVTIALASCVSLAPPPQPVEPLARQINFLDDVKPVLDSRCAVCHSCYNAACQLKLSSFEGVDRGGSKIGVYASRLIPQSPTRLFLDAHTTEQWRDKEFHSVTESRSQGVANDSIMNYFLDAKRRQPVPEGEYLADSGDQTCAADTREVRKFLGKNPGRGMPFGFPALPDEQQDILTTWLVQGAQGPDDQQQAALVSPSSIAATEISKWESFLNTDDPKYALTARYLYEHFFLAHLRFTATKAGEYFQLVRSATAPGEPIEPIATVRPYDDPGVAQFYYRFEKIHSTIVYKTHMVVEIDDETLARYRQLFIDSQWLETPHRMPFDDKLGANPFVIYAQIPPSVRYQFLLDHAEYTIRTFIRGPVCKGQVALNVIHDHFWVMFLDPEADATVAHPEFLAEQADNLRLPTEEGSYTRLLKTFSDAYRDRYANFYKAKTALYERTNPAGFDVDAIWQGRRASDAPLLTIYRHFDSASVHKGALGNLPRTLWVIDYPQFERIYYALVAGFDVFGNVSHQANVRRYMDYLRMEGELNFISFLPPQDRASIVASWYVQDAALDEVKHNDVLTTRPTQVTFHTDDPKREFVEAIVDDHLLDATGIYLDPINYQIDDEPIAMPTTFATHEDILDGFRALTEPGTSFIKYVTDTDLNVLYVRVRATDGPDRMFSIVINRWHDNVNSMFGEQKRLQPAKDTIDFLPGSIGAYPNYFLDVREADIPDLFDLLANFDGSQGYIDKLNKYGINRADERFWEVYDWFQKRMNLSDPVHAGLYDLNRYFPRVAKD